MKRILLPLAAALALGAAATADAATAGPQNFNVKVTLTPTCSISQAPNDVVFTYTSFGGAATATGGDFKVKCTSGLTYTMGLDATSGTETWRYQLPNNDVPAKRGIAYWPGGDYQATKESGKPARRKRFMGIIGFALSILFAVVIFAQWLPTIVGVPCGK